MLGKLFRARFASPKSTSLGPASLKSTSLGPASPKPASPKEEYFTIMILPGPNSRVRKYRFSRTLLRNAGMSLLACFVVSTLMLGEYVHMSGKVWELDSLRAQTIKQKRELNQFACSIVDMKGELAALQAVSDRLCSLARLDVKKSQRLGIGGAAEMSPATLSEFGQKTHREMVDQMGRELGGIKATAADQQALMARLKVYLEHRDSILAATPDIWPVRGFITSNFGYRKSPTYRTREFHEGIDIANRTGTPVEATACGTVVWAGWQSGYGNCVKIEHGFGMSTTYGHLSAVLVRSGERVARGRVVGLLGSTGNSTGPHLHYEVRLNGVPTNPLGYL